jgi:hypothetical protein
MVSRHARTPLAEHLNRQWDLVRGQLGAIQDADAEAVEMARREICVILEVLADEVQRVKRESRARDRDALYGPEASGRFLDALGIPSDHRAWRRLDSIEARAQEQSSPGEVRIQFIDKEHPEWIE